MIHYRIHFIAKFWVFLPLQCCNTYITMIKTPNLDDKDTENIPMGQWAAAVTGISGIYSPSRTSDLRASFRGRKLVV